MRNKDLEEERESSSLHGSFPFKVAHEAINEIRGPLIFLKPLPSAMYSGLLRLELPNQEVRTAQIIDASEEVIIAQVFEGTYNLRRDMTMIIQEHDIFRLPVSDAMLGTPLSGIGRPLDPTVRLSPREYLDVTATPINPSARDVPRAPIETGVPAIDAMNTLVKGQKIPIFTSPGLPVEDMVVRIASHVASQSEYDLRVVFGAMGITRREGTYYMEQIGSAAGADNIAYFMNYIEDPTVERILTPRCALTFAEYLAFEQGYDVLVILSDMLSYAQSLREISAAREEIPGRRGYPGYLYTDMASIYERAGRIKGREGSVTQMPVVTMPNNDITHPVPDLTGYSTEGQIVLSNDLYYRSINPPIDVNPSLSRLMNSGIGEGYTRFDHKYVSNQLYAIYSEGVRLRELTQITGEESLTDLDRKYLRFADIFEQVFVASSPRNFASTLDLGWELLGLIPKNELNRIPETLLEQRYKAMTQEQIMEEHRVEGIEN
jgi:V/A-type H+-transporting ATPase subunit B